MNEDEMTQALAALQARMDELNTYLADQWDLGEQAFQFPITDQGLLNSYVYYLENTMSTIEVLLFDRDIGVQAALNKVHAVEVRKEDNS